MNSRPLLLIALLSTTAMAGCFGGSDFDFEPGTGFKETGRTVHLRATVADILDKEIYPGLVVNMWGFCFEAADPNDEYSANAIEYQEDPGGLEVAGWEGKCSVPGPTLRVQQGDKVIVEFSNEHVHPHTIHWHGQYVPWESDGVPGSTQDSVKPETSFTYEFIASRAGTMWYHCHVDTQFHVMMGLYGVIIVEPQEQKWEPKYDKDQVWVLSTLARDLVEATPIRKADPHADHKNVGSCGVTGEQGCQNPPVDVTPDTFMINGVSFPNTVKRDDTLIKLAPDEKIRLRILNAGTEVETIHTHGHDMYVTHIDGNPLPPAARYYVDTLPIASAQRIDVILEGREGNEGVWVVHTHVADHVTNDRQYPGGMLSKIVYPEFEEDMTPYSGVELPGGLPFIPPLNIPADYMSATRRGVGTTNSVSETWTFPMELGCALKNIWFSAEADSGLSAAQTLNDLLVTITDPAGTDFVIDLGNTRYQEWRFQPEVGTIIPAGNYTAIMSGTAIDATIKMTVLVDYYEDEQQLFEVGDPCNAAV